ncbi:MAG: hypothetical protein R3190_16855, partial [Thermoanaerobaculia bacterium]|nr:hypothetical protein [Thermoanaerobaculia bacterium]
MSSLDPTQLIRAKRLGVAEGSAYALMVGMGETYFLACAVRLGASAIEIGWLVSLPLFLGALGPLSALAALSVLRRRKVWAVGAATLQATLLLVLAFVDRSGRLGVPALIAFACLHQIAGMSTGTAWSSWFGDAIPEAERGRYFAHRIRWVQTSTVVGL